YWTGTLSDTTYFRDLPLPLMIAGPGSNSDVFLAQAFNPTNQPDRSLAIYNAAELEFPTHVGERYQLQSSIDLVNWTNLGSIIKGNGQPYATFQQTRDKSPLFYRLTLAP